MFDFSRVQNYFIACGYTDMRKQIDGLVAVVELQFEQKLDETSIFLFCGRTGSRRCTGTGQGMCCCISVLQKNASSGHGMSRS